MTEQLSVQIKKLEGQVGLKLFQKAGNRVCLSENGIMLQDYTKKIFEIVKFTHEKITKNQKNVKYTVISMYIVMTTQIKSKFLITKDGDDVKRIIK